MMQLSGGFTEYRDYLWQVAFIIMIVFMWILWTEVVIKHEVKTDIPDQCSPLLQRTLCCLASNFTRIVVDNERIYDAFHNTAGFIKNILAYLSMTSRWMIPFLSLMVATPNIPLIKRAEVTGAGL